MVENYCINLKKELEIKLINLLKRIPYRYLKLNSIEILSEVNNTVHILVRIEDSIKQVNIVSFSFYAEKDKINLKEIIKQIKEEIPQDYFVATISGVSKVLNNVSTNLSKKEIPDTFSIIKIPYRQLDIFINEEQIFLNLSISSYQKILSYFQKFKKCPISIEFSEISKFLKRKELITLFLYLSQVD